MDTNLISIGDPVEVLFRRTASNFCLIQRSLLMNLQYIKTIQDNKVVLKNKTSF
ncbi:hypothetical protein [Emticicia sp. C21]|uniref:hypothetical protein n=1 Tax=Emticicia sp. C21 TaxID=2302915 RepID=UPI001313D813|nr:hypothetical protein [Emticicia sp. C21]